jgi:outer membrane translocation and assembly module TamA
VLRSLFSATALVSLLGSLYAQNCPPEKNDSPSTHAPIRRVIFQNAPDLSPQARREITKALRDETVYAGSVSADMTRSADEASERVRSAYQDDGYFKAQVAAKAVPVTEEASSRYDVVVKVLEEGQQYRLGELRFTHMTAFPEQPLRDLFLIQRGEVFSREKIAKGLEKLRQLYGSEGYFNFASVPNTVFDENTANIDLEINVDEGKQFRLRAFEVLGADPEIKARLLHDLGLKPGDVYIADSLSRLGKKRPDFFTEPGFDLELDERDGAVDIVLDFSKLDQCLMDLSVPSTIELRKPSSIQ